MLKPAPGVAASTGDGSALSRAVQNEVWSAVPLCNELQLSFMNEDMVARSTDVVAVCLDCGRGNELVLDMVGVAEDIDQWRRLLVRIGTCSQISSSLLFFRGDPLFFNRSSWLSRHEGPFLITSATD